MKTFKVTVKQEITISFDEGSADFKELWEGYKTIIDSGADYQSFAQDIAYQISRHGVIHMIEGVGWVKLNGKNQKDFCNGEYEEQPGYVNVEVETDCNGYIDFDVSCIDEIN